LTLRLISASRDVAPRLDAQAEGDVIENAHVAEQRVVLEDETDLAITDVASRGVVAFEQDLALIGVFEAGDDAQQRRLAATGGSRAGRPVRRKECRSRRRRAP
jgi:hypothetical protein